MEGGKEELLFTIVGGNKDTVIYYDNNIYNDIFTPVDVFYSTYLSTFQGLPGFTRVYQGLPVYQVY